MPDCQQMHAGSADAELPPVTSSSPETSVLLVADSHVRTDGEECGEFFDMLDAISRSSVETIVFLGDIFELWISLPGYSSAATDRFLAWCRKEKGRRTVGFVEGNHDFNIAGGEGDAFTFSARSHWTNEDGLMFTHGDRIDRRDVLSTLFRLVIDCRLMGWLVTRSFGKRLVRWVKRNTGHAKRGRRSGTPKLRTLPESEIRRFAEAWFKKGVKTILCGHFHQCQVYVYEGAAGQRLQILPAWRETRTLARYNPVTGELQTSHWRDLLGE
ncbi:MAG: metallophosphoesterase [Lentisphaeria bacterium]|nr:metallophosphoesterase [Lentisphaeria bacterium]